jgi:hypothetical protein
MAALAEIKMVARAATYRQEEVMSFPQMAVAPHSPSRCAGEELRGARVTVSVESTVTFW